MTQEIHVYAVKVKGERTFNLLLAVEAPHQCSEYVDTLIKNKFVPGIYKGQGIELSDITKRATAEEFQRAIHTSIEAIAFNPAPHISKRLRLLIANMKPANTFISNMRKIGLRQTVVDTIVLVAEHGHMELLANQLEEEEMWYRWTYGVNQDKQKTRSFMSIEAYIQALQMTIIAHDRLYEKNCSIITDSMYDDLYAHLIELETEYPHLCHSLSPTQRIITSNVDSLEKVRHSRPMLSLKKTKTNEGLLKFIDQYPGEPILVQRKEDGLTAVGHFNDGVPKDFVSRGTGELGERIFHSCSQIENIPKRISFNKHLELRFELVVPFAEFERINTDGKYSWMAERQYIK